MLTCLATFILVSYFHGFHTAFPVNPNVPSSLLIVSLLTFAKVEKYIAALDNSPARNANIFMSLGSSEILNLTSMEVPLQSKEKVFFSKSLISLTTFFRKRVTGNAILLAIGPKQKIILITAEDSSAYI